MSILTFISNVMLIDRNCTICRTEESIDPLFIDKKCKLIKTPCSKITSDIFFALSILGLFEFFTIFGPLFFIISIYLKINGYKKLSIFTSIVSIYIFILTVFSNSSTIYAYNRKSENNMVSTAKFYISCFIIVLIYMFCISMFCISIFLKNNNTTMSKDMFNGINYDIIKDYYK